MRFSLVLATLGRTHEVDRFLASLRCQTYEDFELIIVDQNLDDRLVQIVDKYQAQFHIIHLRPDLKGLSRARNVGLRCATGDIVGFPDDDCWYPPHLLEFVARHLAGEAIDGVTGRTEDDKGQTEGRWQLAPAELNRSNVWKCAISFTIFLRADVIVKTGLFDEAIGVGAGTKWGSGEETDYLLRALVAGARIRYEPDLVVFHPVKMAESEADNVRRAISYSRGTGFVLRKNGYSFAALAKFLAGPTVRTLVNFMMGRWKKARTSARILQGRILGWRDGAEL